MVDPTTLRIAGQPHTVVKWDWGWVDVDDTSDLDFQVYWIRPDMPHIKDGGPIFERVASKQYDSRGNPIYENVLHGGIYPWGEPVKIPIPPFAMLGFKVTVIPEHKRDRERGGRRHKNQTEKLLKDVNHRGWVYWTRTEITCDGPNVRYKVQMAMPGKAPYQKREAEDEMNCGEDGEENMGDEEDIWDQIRDLNAPMLAEDLYDLEDACVVNGDFNPTPRV